MGRRLGVIRLMVVERMKRIFSDDKAHQQDGGRDSGS